MLDSDREMLATRMASSREIMKVLTCHVLEVLLLAMQIMLPQEGLASLPGFTIWFAMQGTSSILKFHISWHMVLLVRTVDNPNFLDK